MEVQLELILLSLGRRIAADDLGGRVSAGDIGGRDKSDNLRSGSSFTAIPKDCLTHSSFPLASGNAIFETLLHIVLKNP